MIPGVHFGVGQELVVVAGYVQLRSAERLGAREPDELEGGMGGRVGQLALQRLQRLAKHGGLAGIELGREPVQPVPFSEVEVDLDWFGDAFWALVAFMIDLHDP